MLALKKVGVSRVFQAQVVSRRARPVHVRTGPTRATPTSLPFDDEEDTYETYETYDARVEAESQKARTAAIERRAKALAAAETVAIAEAIAEAKEALRHHMSASDVRKAVMDAMQTCANNNASPSCAVMWDVADEIFHAYARQAEKEADAKAKEVNGAEEWSIKRRTYDL
jgi:DNA-binding FadR family transcriptional regulator